MNRIALVGLSGVGKSTYLRKLAKQISFTHLEASTLIKEEIHSRRAEERTSEALRTGDEGAFEELLRSMKPSKGLFEIMKSMFSDAWEQRKTQMDVGKDELRKQKLQLDGKIESAVDKIMTLTNTTAVSALEKRIDDLESKKLVLDEKLQNFGKPVHSFSEMFELSLKFIANPWNVWASGQLSLKRTVLILAFSERIAYSRKTGLRTPQVSVPFEFFGGHIKKCEMVHPARFERATP